MATRGIRCIQNPALAQKVDLEKEVEASAMEMEDCFYNSQNLASKTAFMDLGPFFPLLLFVGQKVTKNPRRKKASARKAERRPAFASAHRALLFVL